MQIRALYSVPVLGLRKPLCMSVLDSLFGADAEILSDADFQTLLLANLLAPLGTTVLSIVTTTLDHDQDVCSVQRLPKMALVLL